MPFHIKKYQHTSDYKKLKALISSEGEEWKSYLNADYAINLKQSITYVAYEDDVLCGYARSMSDHGYFIWVIDLLVHFNYRGKAIGKKLLDATLSDYPDQEVFVMSDVDAYYEKLGYKKEVSIFRLR